MLKLITNHVEVSIFVLNLTLMLFSVEVEICGCHVCKILRTFRLFSRYLAFCLVVIEMIGSYLL